MRSAIIFALMFFFILSWNYQPYMDVINGARLEYLQAVAETAISEAKIKGYFSATDLSNIQQAVATHLGYPNSEVQVQGTTLPTTRGNSIDIQISIPTHINLFSMAPASNQATLTAYESADSEALNPS
ncbi:hypothetical protein URH17368_0013 [Alicyclobacillus hesperidum URH17-3-68]|uniref:hypothetical protein n=1 Tax=Alicyclobacillus hesperidum TaxID=89784 RepID=UPI000281B258|nr:hypothetical protein [Alicyclobacillus hesperidum]EJY57290.1 hypothetical protein URH17368_0013 [Alicyclobacillus hesperidum URH17-3-68]